VAKVRLQGARILPRIGQREAARMTKHVRMGLDAQPRRLGHPLNHPGKVGEDYIFLPHYKNRITAGKIIQRQFKELMSRAGVEIDIQTGKKHSIYSLRHTAICMRIVNSQGQVNIFTLAKNAGTSVDQIERFYARHLPISPELWRNLQSFGDAQ
jgi:hypothetical protein